VTGDEIAQGTSLPAEDVNLAVDLLGERRHVRVQEDAALSPYEFTSVELTAAGRETADPTISRDAGLILALICGQSKAVTGDEVQAGTGLTPARINLAVDYLDWRGCLERSRSIGTAPYTFKSVEATGSGKGRRERISSRARSEAASAVR
jgi:hypothetical protein